MAHIFIKTSVLDFTGYAIYRVVENSAPTVQITRQAFAAPHPERGVTFAPLRPVMHQVQLWESADGTSLDTLHATIDIDASINNEMQWTFIEFVVDRGNPGLVSGDTGDPVAGTVAYLDARMLKGLTTGYSIVQRGVGPLRADEYTDDTVHGGFRLAGGPTFFHLDSWFVTVFTATTVQTEVVPDFDVIVEPDDVTIDETYFGKLIVGSGGGDLQTLELPLFADIPDKTRMSFSTQYGAYNYLKLQMQVGDLIKFNDSDKNAVYLARGERIDFIFKAGICYIISYDGRARERGKLYGDYTQRVGTVISDGSEYDAAEMEGLWDWLINDAPANVKCTYALWAASDVVDGDTVFLRKGLFAVDLAGETFKVPDVSGMFERYLLTGDTERTPNNAGGFQNQAVGPHVHAVDVPSSNSDAGSGKAATGGDALGGDSPVTPFDTEANTGTETRPVNIGKIPLIIL